MYTCYCVLISLYCVILQISYDDGYSERVLGGVQASYARETVLEIIFPSLQVHISQASSCGGSQPHSGWQAACASADLSFQTWTRNFNLILVSRAVVMLAGACDGRRGSGTSSPATCPLTCRGLSSLTATHDTCRRCPSSSTTRSTCEASGGFEPRKKPQDF